MTVALHPNVMPPSTNPTRPHTVNTVAEHLDMLILSGNAVGTGDARHVLSAVLVGLCEAGAPRTHVGPAVSVAWLPIDQDVNIVLAAGPDRPSVLSHVKQVAPELKR